MHSELQVLHPMSNFQENIGFKDVFSMIGPLTAKKMAKMVQKTTELPEKGAIFLFAIWVHPAHQGRGIGQTMLRHITNIADDEGSPIITNVFGEKSRQWVSV